MDTYLSQQFHLYVIWQYIQGMIIYGHYKMRSPALQALKRCILDKKSLILFLKTSVNREKKI
jgi:hypothetical protein